jgi:hypothetical protein
MAVVDTPTVGAGGRGGAIGFEPQGPAPAMDHGQVVEGAQRHQVAQRGRAALRSRDQVADLADAGGLVAAGEGAVRVAGGGGAAQVRRDGGPGLAGVERQRHIQRQAGAAAGPGGTFTDKVVGLAPLANETCRRGATSANPSWPAHCAPDRARTKSFWCWKMNVGTRQFDRARSSVVMVTDRCTEAPNNSLR